MTCPDCNEPLFEGVQHQCPNKPHMIKVSVDLFRIPETIQKIRHWWWKWRNKWGSSSGPDINSPGVQP